MHMIDDMDLSESVPGCGGPVSQAPSFCGQLLFVRSRESLCNSS